MGYVESSIAGGRSMKSLAAETGLAYDAIRRHVANHAAPPAPSVAPSTSALPAGSTPYDVMRARVDDLASMDTSKMSSRDRIQHSEELRRAAESLARLAPIDPTAATIRVSDVAGLPELMGGLLDIVDGRHRPALIRRDGESEDAFRGRALGAATEEGRIVAAIKAAMAKTREAMAAATTAEEGT